MPLRTDYSDGGATPTTSNVTASDMNAISTQVNTNTTEIAAKAAASGGTLTDPRINAVKDSNGNTILGTTVAASATSYIGVQNDNGTGPKIYAEGSATDIDLWIKPKGVGAQLWYQPSGNARVIVEGADTNINCNIIPKGTGALQQNGVPVLTTTGTQDVTGKRETLAAGSTTVAPLQFTSGTNLTTPAAGAIEYDGTVFYGTTNASNRGLSPMVLMCRQDATYTLTSQTAVQKLFNASANGRVTLPLGAYRFNCQFALTSMSGTTGNSKFSLEVGTAVLGGVMQAVWGWDMAAGANTAAASGSYALTATGLPTTMHTTATTTAQHSYVTGTFEVTTAGTVIPSIALQTAAAAVVGIGSYFECWQVGSTSMTTVGNWS
jgi:hypothetical protein